MTLAAYAAECRRLALELIEETTQDDIEQVRAGLAGMKEHEWVCWCVANQKEICEVIFASPAKRRQRKLWQDPRLKPRYALAAIQYMIRGSGLLNAVDEYGLHPGCSYRGMAASAGRAYMDLFLMSDVNYWPFDGPAPYEWRLVSLDMPQDAF